jgi:hypothetical protein
MSNVNLFMNSSDSSDNGSIFSLKTLGHFEETSEDWLPKLFQISSDINGANGDNNFILIEKQRTSILFTMLSLPRFLALILFLYQWISWSKTYKILWRASRIRSVSIDLVTLFISLCNLLISHLSSKSKGYSFVDRSR